MVSLGAILSGLWIIIANSWMQTPAGYEVQGDKRRPDRLPGGRAQPFNHAALHAHHHLGVGGWRVPDGRRSAPGTCCTNRHYDVARRSIRLGLVVALIASIGMFLTGDWSSRQVANTSPSSSPP